MPAVAVTTRATLFRVYLGLMVLLALTAATARLPAGAWSLPVALVIATIKLALIFYYFMQLRHQHGFVRIFAFAGFFWLALAMTLTFSDYLTRP